MWIVEVALRRPYTFLVMALLILLATPLVLLKMSTDIFPEINIPVISIVWTYSGLSAQDVGQRITSVNERSLTTTVNDIEHIESESLAGFSIIKIYFQPNANIPTAIAQVVAIEQSQLRQMPPGILPPLVIKYSASAIPVIQLGLSSASMTEQAVFDAAVNFLRPRLVTIPGVAVPWPYGGKQRVISVDLDTNALLAKGLTPNDVVNAVNTQNLVLPSGTAKIGATEYVLATNSSPDTIAGLNNIPVVTRNGATTYLSEVAHVRDGFSPQTNIVRQNGQRGVLVSVIKNGGSSTLDIVSALLAQLPVVEQILPKDLKITPLFDQSGFVRAAISGVVREAVIAAALTAALILVFLGNWRSTCIIAVSIPLSILTSIIALYCMGETLNIMTLGGLALAVGILVDDATVTIENIERHLHLGSDLHKAILDGAGEIAIPALVSTLCICIVFVPMFFLTGVARYLFAPLAEAVVFAMLASYVLSRTLVPTLVMLLMDHAPASSTATPSPLQRIYRSFNARFEQLRRGYSLILAAVLERRRLFAGAFLGFCVLSCGLVFILGRDFFPSVDGGQIRLHMRLPTGTRIEETARVADQVESVIRTIVPAAELGTVLDNLGVAVSGINKTYSNAGTFGSHDGEIQVSLNGGHRPTQRYIEEMRRELPRRFPGVEFFFQPADMVTQILNFGTPSAIDVKVTGADLRADYDIAAKLMKQIQMIPGTVDTHIHQRLDQPTVSLSMDRTQLQQLGLSPNDLTSDLLVSTAGTTTNLAGLLAESDQRRGLQPGRAVAAVCDRQSGRVAAHPGACGGRRNDHGAAVAEQSRRRRPRCTGGGRFALQPGPDDRHFLQRAGPRHGQHFGRYPALGGAVAAASAARGERRHPRSNRDHEILLRGVGGWPGHGDCDGVSADRGQLPVLGGRLHHHHRASGRAGGHLLDAAADRDDLERARADRGNHDHGSCDRQQHSRGFVCAPAHGRGARARQGGARCGGDPHSSGLDDGPGDDHRYDSHGAGAGRGCRAKRAVGARGDRRTVVCHGFHAIFCAGDIRRRASTSGTAQGTPFVAAAARRRKYLICPNPETRPR